MKYLYAYNEGFLDKIKIKILCQKYGIKNYTINSDGSIDVDGDVRLDGKNLNKLPLRFREVTGYFYCHLNQLTTLEGAPKSVWGDFNCSDNKLTTLNGAPQSVGQSFWCNNSRLTTLEGSPQSVGDDFSCVYNALTTLASAPKSVRGDFRCYGNLILDSIRILFPNDRTFYKLYKEWEFFAGGNKIWKHKFLEAMLDIGEELPESIRGYEYI